MLERPNQVQLHLESTFPVSSETFRNMNVLDRKEGLIIGMSGDVLKKLFTEMFKSLSFNLFKVPASFLSQTCMFLKFPCFIALKTWTLAAEFRRLMRLYGTVVFIQLRLG